MRPASALLVLLAGCGLGFADDTSGGADDLPTTGAGPFRRLPTDLDAPLDEPWLASDRSLDQTEPELIARAGGGFHYFVTREPPDLPRGDTVILRGGVRSLRALPDEELVPVLTADQPWEEGHVAAPAIVDLGDRLVVYYEGGLTQPGIGRAESTDRGRTWQKDPGPVLAGATSPGAAFDGTTWLLAVTRPDALGIWLARSAEGRAFTLDPAPVVTARGDLDGAFDRLAVTQPCLRWLEESSGRGHFTLWFAGLEESPGEGDPPRYAVGYAASFEGDRWSRPAGKGPVLIAPAGAPAVLVEGTRATLLFDAANGSRPSVGVATHP